VRAALANRRITFDEYDKYTRADFVSRRMLPIGTGYGTWFNEHLRVGERMKGQCALTLAMLYLNIQNLPALRRFGAEVLKCDTTDECREMMLASLIKGDHRRKAGITTAIFTWATPAIQAIISHETLIVRGEGKRPAPGEQNLLKQLHRWFAQQEAEGSPVQERIRHELLRRAHNSMKHKDTTVTELAHIVEAMARTGVKNENIYEWLSYTFASQHIDQVDFWNEVDKMPEPIELEAFLNGVERPMWLTVVQSDSGNAHKAARYVRNKAQEKIPADKRVYGITLVGRSTGNNCLFTDREIKDCVVQAGTEKFVGLNEIAIRMIRASEIQHLIHPDDYFPYFDKLGMAGDGPDGLWFYFKNGEILMNGSSTHPKAPSNLSLDALTEILWHAYHPKKLKFWLDEKFPVDKYPHF